MKDLLEQVWANPEDDAPRLVYADYLVERGDPRGELIQLQCRLVKEDLAWPETSAAQLRVKQLLADHEAEWTAAFREHEILVVFERGFPHRMIADGAHILAAKHLILTEPVRAMHLLGDLKPHVRALAAAPELARLHALDLDSPATPDWLRDPAFAELCTADLSSLRELEIGSHGLTVASARALSAAPWISGLDRLAIYANPLHDVQMLAPRLAVRELDLPNCGIDDPSGWAISKIETLEELRLSYGTNDPTRIDRRIGEIAAQGLAKLERLRVLDLHGAHLGDPGAAALADGAFKQLVGMSLARTGIRDLGAAAIASSFGTLEILDLSENAIGERGGAAFATSTALRSLRELVLDRNLLGIPGVEALARGKGLPALRRLSIGSNKVYTGDVIHRDGIDELVEESTAQLAARFARKPHLTIA